MKLVLKQTIFITILVSLVLSAGSIVMVERSFQNTLQAAVKRNGEQHNIEQYALKSSLLSDSFNEIPYTDETVQRYVTRMMGTKEPGAMRTGVFHEDGSQIITSLPSDIPREDYELLLRPESSNYLLRKAGNDYYMLLSADIQVEDSRLFMMTAYNINYVFQEKQAQIHSHIILNITLILLAGAASAVLSYFLTRPLKKLSQVSTCIANGAYHERTHIKTRDEIGQLSLSFDKMAEAVEQNVAQLEGQVENRDRFISAFAHEVKTPTTSIMGYADLLRRAPVDEETQLRYANILYHEGRRLEAMSYKMTELLNLSEDGLSMKPIPITSFIEKLWSSRASVMQGITLDKHLAEKVVYAEPDLLFSLLSNLLDNAYKAQPRDKAIAVSGSVQNGRYVIEVRDKGIGISEKDLPHVTELFYRADKSRSREKGGSGIGLYLCDKIARLHGSPLQIESIPGAGTAISFSLEVQDALL